MASREFEALHKKALARKREDLSLSAQEIRSQIDKLFPFFPEPDIYIETTHVQNVGLMRCSAPGVDKKRVMLFFHGGGYTAGSNYSHRELMGRLSRVTRMPVVGVEYRLAPEHPYPAALEDALVAYCAQTHPSHVWLCGLSAGGGLAAALLLRLKQEMLPLPAGAVLLSPWLDLAMKGSSVRTFDGQDLTSLARLDWCAKLYCGEHKRTDPLISPVYGDLAGLPPILIQAGEKEMLLSESEEFARRAEKSHTSVTIEVWPDMIHAWHLFASKVPESRDAIEKVGEWMTRHFP
jgi:monoterpene epsilon-lactone hydrolase